MAMSYVASAGNGASTGATSLAINKPTGTVAGDILLAVVSSNNTDWSPPDGTWTQLQMLDASAGGGTGSLFRAYLYYKVVTSADSGTTSYTFSHPDNQAPLLGHIVAIRGCDTGSPIMDSAAVSTGATASNVNPNPSISVTRSNSPSRALYWRVVRNGSSTTPGTFTESSGGWDLTSQQTAGTGTVRYGVVAAYTGDFASLGSTAPPSGGVLVPTAVTDSHHFMVQLFGAPEGGFTSTLGAVGFDGDAERELATGPVAATLGPATASLAATHYVPAEGDVGATLGAVQSELSGDTPVLAQMGASIGVRAEFVGETRQFGEHIILVEKEDRAFRVVDDGSASGLRPIKRSRVTDA